MLSAAALLVTAVFLRRVVKNVSDVRGDAIDLSTW